MRALLATCLCRLYQTGDLLPLYARVSSLQAVLNDKATSEVRVVVGQALMGLSERPGGLRPPPPPCCTHPCCLQPCAVWAAATAAAAAVEHRHWTTAAQTPPSRLHPLSQAVRVGVLDVLAHLSCNLGRCLAASSLESMTLAVRATAKGSSLAVRARGLRLAAAVVEGIPPLDRNALLVQSEAWKLVERHARVRSYTHLTQQHQLLTCALLRKQCLCARVCACVSSPSNASGAHSKCRRVRYTLCTTK